ncbi:unnamed protein product [Soboliphyme baturini]|uniref:G_PROTEIN_RECEP_F1_2 domain-containing protein n=1 Tax=Soboliphyme baturini TaxID=241478 RepID=A0A183IHW5_9BILA|nr:unnamed protein product [Soboliphyme baturini]
MSFKCSMSNYLLHEDNSTELVLNTIRQISKQYQPVHVRLCITLCTFGTCTNVLNFLVLTRPHMRTSCNMMLAIIALLDMSLMLLYMVYIIHFNVASAEQCEQLTYTYGWTLFLLIHALVSIVLHTTSLWLTALLALVRLVVLRNNQVTSRLLSIAFVFKLFFWVSGIIILFALPSTLAFGVEAIDCLLLKVTFWVNGLIFKVVPCIVLLFSIIGLVRTLGEAKARSERIGGLRKRRSAKYFSQSTTKMLVAVVSIFLITELPQAVLATLSAIYPGEVYNKIYPMLGDLLDLLSLINSSTNFILYCIMSSQFRDTFERMFLPSFLRCCRKKYSSILRSEGCYRLCRRMRAPNVREV